MNLVIVESPAKAKTIEGFLGKGFTVKSSFGHVRDLAGKDKAIDVDNGFEPHYEVMKDKTAIVKELQRLAKKSDIVWLATDEDREGEAISWHLYETLGLTPEKTKRIVFHEITKSAITKAIENPRIIDKNLVDAQQARRVLDRLVGFELSPVLWRKVKPSLSAGRVQSVTVRLIAEREEEVEEFVPVSAYRVNADFLVDEKSILKAEMPHRFEKEEDALSFLKTCKNSEFNIKSIEKKPGTRSPSAPFTTSTLQQEASRKLGYSVQQTMVVAQKLYESGKITYMRTDSMNLSQTAIDGAKDEILKSYGSEYSNIKQYTTKSKGAQEAHEAIRPTNFAEHTVFGDSSLQRLYDLIWKRTVASQMSNAKFEKTNVVIDISKSQNEHFKAKGEVLLFDGFLKVYLEGVDDDDEQEEHGMLPSIKEGQVLEPKSILATEKFTNHPPRYSEASLVKKLEALGIGRPSTYAPTINTVQKRGYVEKADRDGHERKFRQLSLIGRNNVKEADKVENTGAERKKLFPTDIGRVVNDYLVKTFPSVLDYGFTAEVEKEFDEIAEGLKKWNDMIDRFYGPFHKAVNAALEDEGRANGERLLGLDPKSGKNVYAKIGRFGPMIQIGEREDEEKPLFSPIRGNISMTKVTLEQALEFFKLPKTLGEHDKEEVLIAVGRFGPYVKYGTMYVSLDKGEDPMSVELPRAIELIEAKKVADAPIDHYDYLPVQKGVGRFGPFIKWNSIFINVNKKYDFDNLSHEDIVQLIEDKKQKEIDKIVHNWEEEGIRVEKARWGRSNIIKGKTKIELPKTVDAESLSLKDVKDIIEKNKPVKKSKAGAKKVTNAKKK
jgi:DNA topoisomerase-1|tara:strand:+ start:14571 stop:17072 length:2502 start_codon:yes stop_codon:yes gene_type:complete